MRKILFSLTTLFAISITGCLDDAQQPEPDPKVLTAEPTAPEVPEAPVGTPTGKTSDGAAADLQLEDSAANTGPDDTDPLFCNTVADCEEGNWCRLDIHRCIAPKR
jgi:hypothetical protein